MNFREYLKQNIVYLDGGMGTLLFEKGLKPGELPEMWNISHPEIITEIHKNYFESGSNVVSTNTFGANLLKFDENQLDKIIFNAVQNAKNAQKSANTSEHTFIALDIGPTGRLLKPLGDLDFEDAVEIFAKTVRLGVKYGVDLILIETMNDSYETKAALLAAKENCSLPILVSNAYSEDKKLMTGATPAAMVALLEGMGADAIGANCSLGPQQLTDVIEELLEYASVPIILKPNAGLPRTENGKTIFDIDENEFTEQITKLIKKGVRIVGGCCGTTPNYIKTLYNASKDLKPVQISKKTHTIVSSYTHAVKFDKKPLLIGERINPTGKKRFKQALIENDINYILNEGINQQAKGADILDVNVGLPDIDEKTVLKNTVFELQSVLDLPLQIDSSDVVAIENALRIYNGKAMINSVNGKKESMEAVFPIAKKYGGVIVALTLDENGIPDTADGRFKIAENILKTASKYGISKKDIIFDTLTMTVSAEQNAANITLQALKRIRNELNCNTVLGVSNVSFGLPKRDIINGTFFALALENGLSAAIINPYSSEIMKTYYTYNALKGLDYNCQEYINSSESFSVSIQQTDSNKTGSNMNNVTDLQNAIIKGLKDTASQLTSQLLINTDALDIVNKEIIPALNTVGKGFEDKTVYLPQLLMSAEAAKSSFEVIKNSSVTNTKNTNKGTIIIATVKGDIHDIGKNIVKLLLENYGFCVIDLGKDVEPELILNAVKKYNADAVGLSALMTTTVPAMEQTIKLVKNSVSDCKILVGGAVLTEEYSQKIGADKYCNDAMSAVRYLEQNL